MAAGAGARPAPRWVKALGEPLSAAQLRRLEDHRYSAAGESLFEPPLQLFWTWLLQWIPLWIAPNTITLFGLAINLFTTLVLIFYCPTVTEEAPYWTYLLCALGLFIYQSLDAIDGKQARRTNSCSPLGELFDHGCDSLSTVFMAIGASIAVRLGTHPDWLFFCSFVGMFMFYCAHWQTYVSGVLRFGRVDVTEIQVALVIVFLLSTFGGAMMWDYTIPILEIKLKILPVLGVVGGLIFSCSNYFHVILHGGVGKNGSTIAGTSVLSPGLHIGLIIILAIMIYKKSATNVFEKHPCLYTLMFGCVFAKVAQKLVIAHMTKSELYLQDTVFIGPGLLFLDQYFNNFIDEYVVLWIAMKLVGPCSSRVSVGRYDGFPTGHHSRGLVLTALVISEVRHLFAYIHLHDIITSGAGETDGSTIRVLAGTGPGFDFQHPLSWLAPGATPVPGNLMPSPGLLWHCTHMVHRNTHTRRNKH
uniref:Cholinephosphotransferase 1 n=1 Tax=Rattus norvegicus TaxID=10116 RepID=A0ABK0L9E7_RAT|eukprot:XP_006241291.1 PREDICTED: cholinephosphotransferase 1 isoform X2 [Rattus norvegicus]